jgi:hypothetical protein
MMTDYADIARPAVCALSMAKCLRVDLVHDELRRRYAAMHCMQAIHILDGGEHSLQHTALSLTP